MRPEGDLGARDSEPAVLCMKGEEWGGGWKGEWRGEEGDGGYVEEG